MNETKKLLTVKQAAEILGISVRSVWRLIRDNKLRRRRILGSTRIAREDIDDLAENS